MESILKWVFTIGASARSVIAITIASVLVVPWVSSWGENAGCSVPSNAVENHGPMQGTTVRFTVTFPTKRSAEICAAPDGSLRYVGRSNAGALVLDATEQANVYTAIHDSGSRHIIDCMRQTYSYVEGPTAEPDVVELDQPGC